MNKTLAVLTAAALAAPLAAVADSPPPAGDVDVYYSYANQKYEGVTENPGGSGVGIGWQHNLHRNFFVDGEFQYNDQHAEPYEQAGLDYPGTGLQYRQVRAGGGVQFFVPNEPLTLYGKVDYVHYGYHEDSAGQALLANNDDGAGYFLGFSTREAGMKFYAQGGYLDLSDTRGREGSGGIGFPIGRMLAGGSPAEWFVEYRWTQLSEINGGAHDIDYDYRTGLEIPLPR